MSEALKSSQGALWVQTTPGKAPEYLGCVDLDAIAEPNGDQTLIQCRDAGGDYQTVGSTNGVPGAVTTSVTALVFPEASVLDRIKKCLVGLFAMTRDCGRADVFTNYVRGVVLHHARVTTRTLENVVKRLDDTEMTLKLDISAWNPAYWIRKVTAARQDIAETTALLDVTFCNDEQCAGACGVAQDLGEVGFIGGAAPAGSPAAFADIWETDDSGALWMVGGAHPFGAGLDIKSVVCYPVDRTTVRWLAARETDPAAAAAVAYSDDSGVNWTAVTVGATLGEAAAWNGALFALDQAHIWFATTLGNVYFSSDGGLTWTLQDSSTASSGNDLNAVKFSDTDNGYAVGDNGTVIHTTDGGATWVAISTGEADDYYALHVFNRYRVEIGGASDALLQTWDEGVNWEDKAFTGKIGTGVVNDLMFVNDYVGYMVQDTVAPVGYIHRSLDGGHSWERLSTPTNSGLNAVWVCGENLAYVVGKPNGGTAVVIKVSG